MCDTCGCEDHTHTHDAPAGKIPVIQNILDVIFIENVGNLICPVAFDLGESRRVALLSVPEGDDKPYKYPGIFEAVDMVVVTKSDLLPVLDFDLEAFQALVHGLNPKTQMLTLSAKTGAGMAEWLAWIEAQKALISPQ